MPVGPIVAEQLSDKQKLYFHESKAAKYKEYITDKLNQDLSTASIYKQLLIDHPGADVSLDSIRRLVKNINKKSRKIISTRLVVKTSKSEEVRKIAKEMIRAGLEVKASEIVKVMASRGITIHYSHVHYVLGSLKEYQNWLTSAKKVMAEVIEPAPSRKYTLEELSLVKDFLGCFESVERAISAIKSKLSAEEVSLAKEFSDKFGSSDLAVGAIKSYNAYVQA